MELQFGNTDRIPHAYACLSVGERQAMKKSGHEQKDCQVCSGRSDCRRTRRGLLEVP